MSHWKIFQGNGSPHDGFDRLPEPPPWRPGLVKKGEEMIVRHPDRGRTFWTCSNEVVNLVNMALYLRRPLLVTGRPGTGKSSLVYAVAKELKLGEVLYWPITTRTTLKDGLYSYDAIGRAQDRVPGEDNLATIGDYIQLGPLGTAFLPTSRARVLLIDEIDKSDIDLPNDLLHVFEEGRFEIPELFRIRRKIQKVTIRTAYLNQDNNTSFYEITEGKVQCHEFPFIVLTSNGEKEFPPAFLRRCVRLNMAEPSEKDLAQIVEKHLGKVAAQKAKDLIHHFHEEQAKGDLATDQLLNAVYLMTRDRAPTESEWKDLQDKLLKYLSNTED